MQAADCGGCLLPTAATLKSNMGTLFAGHHWDFLGWLLSVWTSCGGWRALIMPLWLISAWRHHVLHQQPIQLCGGCILGSTVWVAMYQAGIFSWLRQLKYLIPLVNWGAACL